MSITAQDFSDITELPIPTTTFDYRSVFGSAELQKIMLSVRNSSFPLVQSIIKPFLEFSGKYWSAYEHCAREFGPRKGKAKFESWLKSETFGIPKNILNLAKDFAPWFRNLEKPYQDLILQNPEPLNINILKKLMTVPPALGEKLLTSGKKLTVALINEALAIIHPPQEKQLKLRKKGYAQVITPGHRLEGQIGQIQYQPDEFDNVILIMFSGGPEESLKIEDVKPVSKPRNQINQIKTEYKFILEEKERELNEKEQEIEYYRSLLQAPPTKEESLTLEQISQFKLEMKSAVLAEVKAELEANKADELALIQAKADKEKEDLQQQLEQRYQQELQEKERELSRLQSAQLQAAEAKAQQLSERVQYLEKIVSDSQNVAQKDIGNHQVAANGNGKREKPLGFGFKKNTEIKQKVVEQETPSVFSTENGYETTASPKNLDSLTDELSTTLKLFSNRPGGGKGTDVESVSSSDKLGSMDEKQLLPQNQEIFQEDWEKTPLSVKQWVESWEKQLWELKQRLAQRQAEQQSLAFAEAGAGKS